MSETDLDEIISHLTLNEYQVRAASTIFFPRDKAIEYCALKLNGEAGEVAELVGKMFRDDEGFMTPERKANLIKEVGDVFWYVAAFCTVLEIDLAGVAFGNLMKLQSRKERGVLSGSGSDR